MENDRLLEQLNQLFDNKLKVLREHVDESFRAARQDTQRANERITKLSQGFHEDQTRLNNRLDLVAAQVATVGDDVNAVKEIASGHAEDLDKIQRLHDSDLDRLDDHGGRIETLEAKTAHLPTPPRG
jgi:outer membrane murein-binding lipoprotein Lpp